MIRIQIQITKKKTERTVSSASPSPKSAIGIDSFPFQVRPWATRIVSATGGGTGSR